MARKTSEVSTTRSRKKAVPVPGAVEVPTEVGKNSKAVNQTAVMAAPENLEEEIRRRAYELYLQRRATSGGVNGDENQDWFVAEREIRSRRNGAQPHSA